MNPHAAEPATGVIGTTVVVVALLALIMFMVRGRLRPGFNPRRAATAMRSPTGTNAAVVLAVAQMATLALDTGGRLDAVPGLPAEPTAGALVGALVVFVVAAAVAPAPAAAVAGVVGVAASLAAASVSHGPSGLAAMVVVLALTLFLLATARGFVR